MHMTTGQIFPSFVSADGAQCYKGLLQWCSSDTALRYLYPATSCDPNVVSPSGRKSANMALSHAGLLFQHFNALSSWDVELCRLWLVYGSPRKDILQSPIIALSIARRATLKSEPFYQAMKKSNNTFLFPYAKIFPMYRIWKRSLVAYLWTTHTRTRRCCISPSDRN